MTSIARRTCGLGLLCALALQGAALAQTPALPNPAAAPGNDAAARAAATAKANVDVTDGWTRATPGNATTAAVYLRIINVGKEPDKLIGVGVGAAQKAELHTGTMANGVMRMEMVPAVVIPAGGTVTFSPAGNHIMLIGLKAPLKEGESFLVTLDFEKAGKETAVVKIAGANAMGPPAPAKAGNTRDVTSGATQPPPSR